MVKQTKKIKFICCYFGQWPVWFPGFLLSCKYNKNIDWLFFTDCKIPKKYPSNVKFVKCSMDYLSELVTTKLKFRVKITEPYKLCDLKPVYGLVFEDYLDSYDFWGMCDIDIIYGDIRKFITEKMLNENDIISSRVNNISGHFNLFRNKFETNNIFRKLKDYELKINQQKHFAVDEKDLSRYLKEHTGKYKISWNTWLLNFPHNTIGKTNKKFPSVLSADDGPWYWNKGRLFIDSEEVMYLHFMNWKGIKNINVSYEDDVDSFYISSTRIEHLDD